MTVSHFLAQRIKKKCSNNTETCLNYSLTSKELHSDFKTFKPIPATQTGHIKKQ